MFSKDIFLKNLTILPKLMEQSVFFHFHTGHIVFIPGMLFFPILQICQNQNMISVIYVFMNLAMATKELLV